MREYSVRNKSCLDMNSVHISNPLYSPYDREQAFSAIYKKVTETLHQSQSPVILGADHSISYPAIQVTSDHYGSYGFGYFIERVH